MWLHRLMMIIISISIDILILNFFFLCFEPSFPSGTLDVYSFRNFTIFRTTDIAGEIWRDSGELPLNLIK